MSSDPTIMICVGATKAGTSSLYRYVHDHPDCYMRSIKEIQYFNTVDFNDYDRQYDVLARHRASLIERQNIAKKNENKWKVNNLQRQIDDIEEMVRVLKLGDDGLNDYLFYLLDGIEGRKVAGDITPGYALLSDERIAQMATMAPDVRFVFLMRDPIDRLWSHVRMQATRQRQEGEEVHIKARRIMNRTMKKNMETHIPERGDYAKIVEKLRRNIPEDKLFVGFTEDVLHGDGLTKLCDFLSIAYKPVEKDPHAHKGVELKLSDRQRQEAAEFLAPQYAYVEKTFGELPQRWQANMARI